MLVGFTEFIIRGSHDTFYQSKRKCYNMPQNPFYARSGARVFAIAYDLIVRIRVY